MMTLGSVLTTTISTIGLLIRTELDEHAALGQDGFACHPLTKTEPPQVLKGWCWISLLMIITKCVSFFK